MAVYKIEIRRRTNCSLVKWYARREDAASAYHEEVIDMIQNQGVKSIIGINVLEEASRLATGIRDGVTTTACIELMGASVRFERNPERKL